MLRSCLLCIKNLLISIAVDFIHRPRYMIMNPRFQVAAVHFVTAMTTACELSVSGGENGAEWAENRVKRGAETLSRCCRKTTERSGAWSGRSRSGNGAGSRLGSVSGLFAAHAQLTCSGNDITHKYILAVQELLA